MTLATVPLFIEYESPPDVLKFYLAVGGDMKLLVWKLHIPDNLDKVPCSYRNIANLDGITLFQLNGEAPSTILGQRRLVGGPLNNLRR